jgi:N-formylglutamate amidohydrolase
MPNGDLHLEPASAAMSGDSGEAILNLVRPQAWRAPLIVASPHSGHHYPPAFLASTGLTRQELRLSEDCYVDELVAAAPELGVPLLAALFPRSFCDVNREPLELDPSDVCGPAAGRCQHRLAPGRRGSRRGAAPRRQ